MLNESAALEVLQLKTWGLNDKQPRPLRGGSAGRAAAHWWQMILSSNQVWGLHGVVVCRFVYNNPDRVGESNSSLHLPHDKFSDCLLQAFDCKKKPTKNS